MKTIIVPTDFSSTARNAFLFAQELASFLNSQLIVIHAYHPGTDSTQFFNTALGNNEVALKREQLDNFVKRNAIEASNVKSDLILGFAADEIVALSKEGEERLIVMGMTGEGGLLEKTFGSISSHVSQKSECPVLLIPAKVQFAGIRNIAYTSEYEGADDALFEQILSFASIFKASIHLVQVNSEKEEGDIILEDLVAQSTFEKHAPELTYQLAHITGDTVWEGLSAYVMEHQIDMVVMVTRKRNFWERLLHQSTTKQVVERATFPVMVLHV